MIWKKCLAEGIGTFALVFIGAGSICSDQYTGGGVGLLGIALAHGLVLSIAIYATGHISGGHINPAVTFGFLITNRISVKDAVFYILSQLAGAVLAGFLLTAIFPAEVWNSVHLGTPLLGEGIGFGAGVLVEMILTFFLLFSIFGTAVDERAPKGIYGFAIGLVLAFDILVGGPLTGASMNPARTFGPALVAGFWENHLVYWIGPLMGGGLAALVYHHLLMEKNEK